MARFIAREGSGQTARLGLKLTDPRIPLFAENGLQSPLLSFERRLPDGRIGVTGAVVGIVSRALPWRTRVADKPADFGIFFVAQFEHLANIVDRQDPAQRRPLG